MEVGGFLSLCFFSWLSVVEAPSFWNGAFPEKLLDKAFLNIEDAVSNLDEVISQSDIHNPDLEELKYNLDDIRDNLLHLNLSD